MKNFFILIALTAGLAVPVRAEFKTKAVLSPIPGQTASGVIYFEEKNGVVTVTGKLQGLKGDTVHGLHILENGSCFGLDAEGAGDHFNPAGMAHGGPGMPSHHAGDLGNVRSLKNGSVDFAPLRTSEFSLDNSTRSIVGRSVILHENADDLVSQPAGNSGGRIACGVIEAAN